MVATTTGIRHQGEGMRNKCSYCNGVGFVISSAYNAFAIPQAIHCPLCSNNPLGEKQLDYNHKMPDSDKQVDETHFDYI